MDSKVCHRTESDLNLDQLTRALTLELGQQRIGGKTRDIGAVSALMARWNVTDRKNWEQFAQFDQDKSYTRNLISSDDVNFTLMMLCWNKGKLSPIHDHANSECWVRIVSGTALEEQFIKDPCDESAPLQLKTVNTVPAGGVTHIHDRIGLHRLGNASSEHVMISLHCYSPPFRSCKVFPDKTSHGVDCNVSFYSVHGVKHESITLGPSSVQNINSCCVDSASNVA
uniref:Cysteine dioxygenase n=1 Tax=Spongospora subterranea TaxID=70186 RepID=A0A0H5QSK0_9EUKA|eukprot:CRZ04566.1 hypothetical protein [Spongospora subterranea]